MSNQSIASTPPIHPSEEHEGPRYGLSNAWSEEHRRLSLLEKIHDPITAARLAILGVDQAARCLELGGGSGSIARWLCRRVGDDGHVTAVDLDTRWLDALDEPNLTVLRHDLTAPEDPVAPGSFDYIHARAVLEHIADRDQLLDRICRWLAPGGWLYLCDCVSFPLQSATNRLYSKAMRAWVDVLARTGTDYNWGSTFPLPLQRHGLQNLGAEAHTELLQGGSPTAQFWSLTLDYLRPKIIDGGLITGTELDAVRQLLDDDSFWDLAPAFIGAWGQKPTA